MGHSKSSNAPTADDATGATEPSPIVRIAEFWNWLPAFRAVAESRHLPTASRLLGVSASALSRSVRLLEANLHTELFHRIGSRLVLTENGEALLAAVRNGMRGIHDGMLAIGNETLNGTIKISSHGAVTTVAVVPALLDLRNAHPGLRGSIVTTPPAAAEPALLSGALDLALHSVPVEAIGLESTLLGHLHHGIYCGVDHPATRSSAESIDRALEEHAFVTPGVDANGVPNDGWPVDRPRKIGLIVDQMRVGAEVCAGGGMLAVLPDLLVDRLGLALHRLPIDLVTPTPVFALSRCSLDTPSRARVVLDAIAAHLPTN